MLSGLGYTLKAKATTRECGSRPDGDAQFVHINRPSASFRPTASRWFSLTRRRRRTSRTSRTAVERQHRAGQCPRFHRRGVALRGARCRENHRLSKCRHQPRNHRIRSGEHPALVASAGQGTPSGRRAPIDHGRFRRLERTASPAVEDGTAGTGPRVAYGNDHIRFERLISTSFGLVQGAILTGFCGGRAAGGNSLAGRAGALDAAGEGNLIWHGHKHCRCPAFSPRTTYSDDAAPFCATTGPRAGSRQLLGECFADGSATGFIRRNRARILRNPN